MKTDGSRAELHAVKPAISANRIVVSENGSAIGFGLYMKSSSSASSSRSSTSLFRKLLRRALLPASQTEAFPTGCFAPLLPILVLRIAIPNVLGKECANSVRPSGGANHHLIMALHEPIVSKKVNIMRQKAAATTKVIIAELRVILVFKLRGQTVNV
jgi:hypothetical protein